MKRDALTIPYEHGTERVEECTSRHRRNRKILKEYEALLRDVRGLKSRSILKILSSCRKFLDYASTAGIARVRSLSPEIVQKFVVSESLGRTRVTVAGKCWQLRGFLSYLHSHGKTGKDLSAAIIAPRIYRHENCPRYLTRAETEHTLS